MATLLKVWVDRHLVGVCDRECYNADGGDCDCCCGGVNHGVGLLQATRNLREISLTSIADWIQARAPMRETAFIMITPRHR